MYHYHRCLAIVWTDVISDIIIDTIILIKLLIDIITIKYS